MYVNVRKWGGCRPVAFIPTSLRSYVANWVESGHSFERRTMVGKFGQQTLNLGWSRLPDFFVELQRDRSGDKD